MAAVVVSKPGKPTVTIETATQFVNLIYAQGYRPVYGTIAQAWETFYNDAPPGDANPEWPETPEEPLDPSEAAGLAFRAAVMSVIQNSPDVDIQGLWDFFFPPTIRGVEVGSGGSTGSVDGDLAAHLADPTPHTAYDVDIPDLKILFENGIA